MESYLEVDRKLSEVKDKMLQSRVGMRKLAEAGKAMAELEAARDALVSRLEKEEADVERLKSLSFANFWHTLKSDKQEMQAKEEKEAMEAKRELDLLTMQIDREAARMERLRASIGNERALAEDYRVLLEEKRSLIMEKSPERWFQIEQIHEALEGIETRMKELDEAIEAGKSAFSDVEQVMDSLESAADWGAYDILGGGFLATAAKRSHMDDAQHLMHSLKDSLRRFDQELRDVGGEIDSQMEVASYFRLADWFFDGLFVDLAVQSRIREAQERMDAAADRIGGLVGRLERDRSTLEAQAADLKEKEEQLVVRAGLDIPDGKMS